MRKALSDFIPDALWTNETDPKEIHKILAQKNACYVLITCGKPSASGEMKVEMTYEGDATLAAYLLESAQGIIEEKAEGS